MLSRYRSSEFTFFLGHYEERRGNPESHMRAFTCDSELLHFVRNDEEGGLGEFEPENSIGSI